MNTPNSEIKTPTPRTDAEESSYDYRLFPVERHYSVDADFARKLEQELYQAQQASAEYIFRTDLLLSCGYFHDEKIPKCGLCRACLQDELQQMREELANWKQCSTCEHDDKISLSTKLEIEHEARLEVVRQLSQWQECAREMAEALERCDATNYSGWWYKLKQKSLSLFTQLTQSKE